MASSKTDQRSGGGRYSRDDKYEHSHRRRSRSPRRERRDRSPDRYRDDRGSRREREYLRERDRYSDDRRRDRDREREYDVRDRDDRRRRDDRRDSERRRGSPSATPSADVKRGSGHKSDDRVPREERQQRSQETPLQDKDANKQSDKLARLEAWKRLQAEKAEKKAKKQAETPGAAQSPAVTAPPTPTAVATPPAREATEEPAKAETRLKGEEQKITFKLDESAKAQPLQNTRRGPTALQPPSQLDPLRDETPTRLQWHRTKLNQASRPAPKLEQEDTSMEDAPTTTRLNTKLGSLATPEDVSPMEIDVVSEDLEDPLEAFMSGLSTISSNIPHGEALFDDEPGMHAVQNVYPLPTVMKKKRDIPVVDHQKVAYQPFRKDFYTEPREVSQLTPEEVADLRLELDGIKVSGKDHEHLPRPVTNFAQMGLLSSTMRVLQEVGYTKPTPIQCQAIPIAESGHDMIAIAKTGSGKTLAFGIPIIRHILDQPPLKSADGPIGLILAPTRELSLQIVDELKPFLKASGLKIACAYGGAPISGQIATIKRGGIHVLCATPGRLIDLLQSNSGRVLSFKRITYVVLDEADRMFDQGFENQILKILASVRLDRQSILFSATFPKAMSSAAQKILTNPVRVEIGGKSVVPPEITQIIKIVPPSAEKKMAQVLLHLGKLFEEDEDARALIFVERQETAEDLLSKLLKRSYPCNSIHGAKEQTDRQDAINDFKNGAIPLLIATSVAARGLDVPQLKLVINFDISHHLEDHVHRCGRTGRAGNTGTAVTLIEKPGQERYAVFLVKSLTDSGQPVPEELREMSAEFNAKVKAGEEKWYDPGFGGKGLDRLDAARASEKKREKRARKGEFDDDSDSEPEIVPTAVKKSVAAPAASTPTTDAPEEPAWMKLLTNPIVVNKTERPSADNTKPMSAMERVKAAAASVDGRLSKKGMIHHGQPIDNKGPDAGAYHSTIEINDFPQKARWAVTNRTNVAKILDATATSITTKGTFYPAGKSPGETDLPKLYILIEGESENAVTQAVIELQRLLREGTDAAQEAGPRGATGRYSVV